MNRAEKVAEEIKHEISLILQEEVRDPRLGFTTITKVELTNDLRFARVYFSVYGNEEQWKNTQATLDHASGFVRRLIGGRLNLRFVPEIVFKADHSGEYSVFVEQQLEQIKTGKKEEEVAIAKSAVSKKKEKNASKKTPVRNKKKK